MAAARRFKLFFAFFPYGGTGGSPTEHPAIRTWFAKLVRDCSTKYASQVAEVQWMDFADTPVTMTRNQSVLAARKAGADILIMVDSDMVPDYYCDPNIAKQFPDEAKGARPFLEVALEQFERRYSDGAYSICAPYCGLPPDSCVCVFRWREGYSGIADGKYSLDMYSREEASMMTGVGEVAAQPTGLVAFDMRLFSIVEPDLSAKDSKGFFYYEYSDGYQAKKGSTEDVTCTRDMSMIVQRKHGYQPLLCAWDCWAGHVKPVVVGKPRNILVEHIEPRYYKAALDGAHVGERIDAATAQTPTLSEALSADDDPIGRMVERTIKNLESGRKPTRKRKKK